MMLCLHLFNRDFEGLFEPLIFIGNVPLSYYISLFCDVCVPIFAFVSGYGLFFKFQQASTSYQKSNLIRIGRLYINYWIILILFVIILGLFLSRFDYLGDVDKFLLNFTAIKTSYNGAWWFLTIYILFVLSSSFWFNLLLRINRYIYLFILFFLYVVGFYFRVYDTHNFESVFLDWLHTYASLYFCTLLQFMLGAFVLHFNIHSKISNKSQKLIHKNYIILFVILGLIVIHGLIPNLFFAPFFGLVFILLYCQLNLNKYVQHLIDFFTPHATNMWLIHMFFYLIYFEKFIYTFKYVFLIYIVLVGASVLSSYIVNFLNGKLQKLI